MIGQTLSHYRILEKLGEGGRGEVYLAQDLQLDRRVALKVLPPDMARHPEDLERFEREARTLAALDHANIVTIHSVEESNGVHFLTMELVQGKTLARLIPKNGLRLGKIFDIAIPLADALASTHGRGITHRDLKPENLMVDDDGHFKVLDFGLAKLGKGPVGLTSSTQAPTEELTREGAVLGTVSYMSPEQAEGKPVDSRSDVFSLGVILYQMATGQRPFEGDTQISTITSILRDTPPLITELRQTLPRHLGRIVKRCLAKEPERRYATAVGLRNDLEELREEIDSGELIVPAAAAVPAAPAAPAASVTQAGAPQRGIPRRVFGGTAALALVAAATAAYLAFRGTEIQPVAGPPAIEMTRLTTSGLVQSGAISPDGRYVAHIDLDRRGWSLWVTQVSTRSTVEVLSGSKDRLMSLAFSPDGEYLYYRQAVRLREHHRQLRGHGTSQKHTPGEGVSHLVELPFLGGTGRLVLSDVDSRISFSPDGQRFVFMRWAPRESIGHLIVGTPDGEEEVLAEMNATELLQYVAWSPDGETIALTVRSVEEGFRDYLVALPLENPAARRRLTREIWDIAGRPVWLPDGSSLIFDATDHLGPGGRPLFRLSYPSGKVERVTHDLGYYDGATVTEDGSVLAVLQRQSRFHVWKDDPADARAAESLTSGSGDHGRYGVACAPDGGIVFDSDIEGLHLRRVDPDGSGDRRLTEVGEIAIGPAVSPDGRWLVYATAGEVVNLWKVPDESGRAERLTDGRAEYYPAIAPDGQVYYLDLNQEEFRIARVPLEGGEPEAFGPLENLGWGQLRISPEGSRLLFVAYDPDTSKSGAQIVSLADAKALQLVESPGARGSAGFEWAPDGEAVTYVVDEGGISNVWSQPLAGGPPRRLTDYDSLEIESFCWAADGKSLVMSRGEYSSDVVLIRNFG